MPTVVVFERPALERLSAPAAAVADVRDWSDVVGVLDRDREAMTRYLETVGIEPDFITGVAGRQNSLGVVRQRNPGERHVLIGVDEEARETAEAVGWEYLDVEAAADAAGWRLA